MAIFLAAPEPQQQRSATWASRAARAWWSVICGGGGSGPRVSVLSRSSSTSPSGGGTDTAGKKGVVRVAEAGREKIVIWEMIFRTIMISDLKGEMSLNDNARGDMTDGADRDLVLRMT